MSKTKEIIIDFRHNKDNYFPLTIKGEQVEIVQQYKYLGFIVDDKLNWNEHVTTLCKKINQRMYFLRKLKSFNLNETILKRFYTSMIESVISYGISCWGAAIKLGDRKRINNIIKKAGRIVKCELDDVETIHSKACLRKQKSILSNTKHPLNTEFVRSSRSNKLLQPASRTERYKNSFVPASVRLLRTRSVSI